MKLVIGFMIGFPCGMAVSLMMGWLAFCRSVEKGQANCLDRNSSHTLRERQAAGFGLEPETKAGTGFSTFDAVK